jgi:hypothetical protein
MLARSMKLVVWICAFLISGFSGRAFVFYNVGTSVLKWNVNSPKMNSTVVNPTTKAIRYYIASDAYSAANRENEINAVKACFDQWQNVPGAKVRFEFAGFISPEGLDARDDNTNVVFWAKKSLRVSGGAEDLTNRRGLTTVRLDPTDGSIRDADIVLNGIQYQWFTDANDSANQGQFVESIVSHEIGHFLGLDHTPAGGATVIDGGNGINTNSGLSADEVAAARYLYPDGTSKWGSVTGVIRMNGTGILGAAVIVEDAYGNIVGATVTQSSGKYAVYSLPGGTYKLRVSPLDPANSGNSSLLRGAEIAVEYTSAVTSFLPTENFTVTVQAGETKNLDVNVTFGEPPFRITSLSKPTQADLPTVVRFAVTMIQGQSNYFIGVSSSTLPADAILSVTGDGLTVGRTAFYAGRIAPGLNTLVVPISVSSNATPGLRTLVVTQGGNRACANGYLEIASPVQDYNFDGLNDRFQRTYWKPWTAPEAAPMADPDNDGFSNGFEYRTNTDPTNPASNKLVLLPPVHGRFGPQLSWVSDPGKTYQVYSAPVLAPNNWQPLGQAVTVPTEIWSIAVDFNVPARFYQLELKR